MQREDHTLTVVGIDDSDQSLPTMMIESDAAAEKLHSRFEDVDGAPLEADRIDVSFRFTSGLDADDPTGVLGITDRLTGDFVLEVNADGGTILSFVREARRQGKHDGGDGQYRIRVVAAGETLTAYGRETLLVYNNDGDLLREHSLIPGGVEL